MKKVGRQILEKVKGDKEIQLFDQFSTSLTSEINLTFKFPTNIKTLSSKRSRCWSKFHALRQEVFPKLWQDFFKRLSLEVNGLFMECVNQEVFQQILVKFFAEECRPIVSEDHTVTLERDQLNAMRYACGYVPHLLLKKYKTNAGVKAERFVQCLEKMAIQSESDSNIQDLG